ncbi:uncharacterized protein LOC143243280 [Tachypleus tridentatus]|uniref:uncharacterized protein LOC143243280 n=1 Tax=Tachypleus tridentatus TaxID=6853 RepID=UPI003FD5DFC9
MANYTQLFYIFGSFLLVSGFKFVYETERGSTLTLICSNQAYKRGRKEIVIWYSNRNELVINNERTQIKYGGKLVLTDVEFEDAGIYTCKNREGDYKHDVRVYVPAENLNCTRGYQRDVNRCYPCPPGHYDNGSQTHCLPCPGGTYMTSFAADACIPCPGDKITDEEGADNKDLCRNRIEVVSKATLHLTSKSTVPRCAWRTALILMCLTALCVLCFFYTWKSKPREERNVLKNRVEHKQLGDEKITTDELDILEAMPLIPECEKEGLCKRMLRRQKLIFQESKKVTKRTTLETIYENDLERKEYFGSKFN